MLLALIDPAKRDTDMAQAGALLLGYALLDLRDLAHGGGG